MTIIRFLETPTKGENSAIQLDIQELIQTPTIQNPLYSHFQDPINWNRVMIRYHEEHPTPRERVYSIFRMRDADVSSSLQVLESENPTTPGEYGSQISYSDDFVLITARLEQSSAGKVYVYENTEALDSKYSLTSPNPQSGGRFGESIETFGDYSYIGAPAENDISTSTQQCGRVHAYRLDTQGTINTFVEPIPSTGNNFGKSVCSTIIVNRQLISIASNSGVYRYSKSTNSDSFSRVGGRITLPNNDIPKVITESEGYLFVAAVGGKVYVYQNVDNIATTDLVLDSQVPVATLEAPDQETSFGELIKATKQYVYISAPRATVDGKTQAGLLYMYKLSDLSFVKEFKAPDPTTGSEFGSSLDASSLYIVIGERKFDQSQTVQNSGRAYVYKRKGNSLLFKAILKSDSPENGGNFGAAVAVTGDRFLVGAPYEVSSTGANQAGRVHQSDMVNNVNDPDVVSTTFINFSNTSRTSTFKLDALYVIDNDLARLSVPISEIQAPDVIPEVT